MILNSANAHLSYNGKTFPLWVMRLEQSHELAGATHQSHTFQHFYPKSYFPGPMTIAGRVRNQDMYNELADFIRGHQLSMINNTPATNAPGRETLPLMEFNFPYENLSLTGWVAPFEAGAKRFNVAPEYTLTFMIAADRHSTNDRIQPSRARRGWWTGTFMDFDTAQGAADVGSIIGGAVRGNKTYKQLPWPTTEPDPPQLTAAPIYLGSGGSGSDTTGGRDTTPLTLSEVQAAIAAAGASLDAGCVIAKAQGATPTDAAGNKMIPHMVMQVERLAQGIAAIKYVDLTGGTTTNDVNVSGCKK